MGGGKDYNCVKHIDLWIHFIRDKIEKEKLEIQYVKSKKNVADIFTKLLALDAFNRCKQQLGIMK